MKKIVLKDKHCYYIIFKFKNCKYLEIGTNKNSNFDTIPLKTSDKYGVDPVRGGNFRMTSDEFLKKFKFKI